MAVQPNTIDLDGSAWRTELDFYDALAEALGSFPGHGRNPDAFTETMVYYLDLNDVQPPYIVQVRNSHGGMRDYVEKFSRWLAEAREDRRTDPEWGDDVEVSLQVV